MKTTICVMLAITSTMFFIVANAQTNTFPTDGAVGVNTLVPDSSSLMEIRSIHKGLLIPRMTKSQRDNINAPATGLLIFQTNSTPGFYYFDSSRWRGISRAGLSTDLSNLSDSTAADADLMPNSNNAYNLGSAALQWNTINGISLGAGNGNNKTNTVAGFKALYSNTGGYSNVAIGVNALYNNDSGHNMVAIGDSALFHQTSNQLGVYDNMAIGSKTLFKNTTGVYNTAIGNKALYFNITGIDNTSSGYQSLYTNTVGSACVANGYQALYLNSSGYSNVANGYQALYANTTGNSNTADGYEALYSNTSGKNNTALGYFANVSSGSLTNAMVLGYYASVNASNKVVVGNTSVTVIGGQVGWSTFSDGRFKKDIQQNVPGLTFINKLKPVTYHVELQKFEQFLGVKDSVVEMMKPELQKQEQKLHTGFVAQDVEQAAKEINYDFDAVNHPQNEKDNYSLVYADFVPSLVKAIQELSTQNDSLKSEITNLQSEMQQIKTMMMASQSNVNSQQPVILSSAALSQNVPNPFNNSTTIQYSIPQKFNKAQIIISDENGKQLKAVTISAARGFVSVDASTLSSGAFQYSLIVDGKLISTKQMEHLK